MSHWTDSGCEDMGDGVFRIPLQMPNDGLQAVNVYAVETGVGLALIDGGWRSPTGIAELTSALASVGHDLAQVHDIYVTHSHSDHYTLAVEIRRQFGARIHLGHLEAPSVNELLKCASNVPTASLRELRRSGDPELAERIKAMMETEPFDLDGWEQPDHWLRPGQVTVGGRKLDAVPTPGHTKGHLVFHDLDNTVLFSGDHILPGITPSIGFELGEWDLPLARYLASLELILQRPDARLLPAHGAPGPSAQARATEILEHHDVRLSDTCQALERGAATAADVARLLTWTRRGRTYDELDDFNAMIATCETIAHLDVLVERGSVAVTPAEAGARFALC